jgi:hypothetical protein
VNFPGNLVYDARGRVKRVFLVINNTVTASTAAEESWIKMLLRSRWGRSLDSDPVR